MRACAEFNLSTAFSAKISVHTLCVSLGIGMRIAERLHEKCIAYQWFVHTMHRLFRTIAEDHCRQGCRRPLFIHSAVSAVQARAVHSDVARQGLADAVEGARRLNRAKVLSLQILLKKQAEKTGIRGRWIEKAGFTRKRRCL